MWRHYQRNYVIELFIEHLRHLFYHCDLSLRFWSDVSAFLFLQRNVNYMLSLKDVICTISQKSKMIQCVVNFYILQGKYYIHKQKFAKCTPKCNIFYQKWMLWKAFKLKKNCNVQSFFNKENIYIYSLIIAYLNVFIFIGLFVLLHFLDCSEFL